MRQRRFRTGCFYRVVSVGTTCFVFGLRSVCVCFSGLLLVLIFGCISPPYSPIPGQEFPPPEQQISHQLRLLLNKNSANFVRNGRDRKLVQRFYQAREFRPAWSNSQGVSRAASKLLGVLITVGQDGLLPDHYRIDEIRELLAHRDYPEEEGWGRNPQQVARLDLLLTGAFLGYASDSLLGQHEARWRRREWQAQSRTEDPVALLNMTLDLNAMDSALAGLQPAAPAYQRLKQAISHYKGLARRGGWPEIPEGPAPRLGDIDWRIPWLRELLFLVGDLIAEENPDEFVFSSDLKRALQHFQARHGLVEDGIMGPDTLAQLNVSAEKRVEQLLGNLERYRWLAKDSGSTCLLINLAACELKVVEKGEELFSMPVIIGKPDHSTPLLSSEVRSIVFSPYWYVPKSFQEKIIPRMAADAGYLKRHRYEWLDLEGNEMSLAAGSADGLIPQAPLPGLLRQKPGQGNPMGRIKFILPNDDSIYLHDTPQQSLFKGQDKARSAGCIRLSEPEKLAAWLLKPQGWGDLDLRTALQSNKVKPVTLENPVPVHIQYWTSWVDDDGSVHFRSDLYQRDQALRLALGTSRKLLSQ